MKKLIPMIIGLMSFISIHAQTGTITGQVLDGQNEPQEFVNILLINPIDSSLITGTVTEANGTFILENVALGRYQIIASMIGFNDVYSVIFETDNHKTILEPIILKEGIELEGVTVTAKKPFIELKADKIVVNVENSTVNAGNSAIEILEKSPGVTLDKDNNISLRGRDGVLVMIDGKNQYLTGDELVTILESMPAENIQNIEIITNPSAKYDAEGNSGIINIKLKKNTNLGLNGSVAMGARHGERFSNNASLDFNYRSEKLNVYGSGSRSAWGGFQVINLNRQIPFNNGTTNFAQRSDMLMDRANYNVKLGADYTVSKKTTVGLLYKGNLGDNDWVNDGITNINGDNAPSFNSLAVLGETDGTFNQNSFNLNVAHQLDDKGTALSFDTDYSVYNRDNANHYTNNYYDFNHNQVADPFLLRNDQGTDISIFASKLDYNKTLKSGIALSLGAKVSIVEIDNNTLFEAFMNETWENQSNRSNSFLYGEDVMAVYANGAKQIGKVNISAGLRMEHTESVGNSLTLEESVSRSYTNLFPSVSIAHPIGENHNLSYSYSRRLNRPNYKDLNPFIEYLDEYTFEKGNPFLNPQYSDAFGLNYSYKNAFFVSANYSKTSGAITEIIEQSSEENQTFATNVNLDNHNSASLTISTSLPLSEKITSRINATAFYNDFQSIIPSGVLNNQNLAYNIYIGNEINLPKGIAMELSGNYRSGLTYGLFKVSAQYGIDVGFSKDIMQGKGSLKIGLDDIFYTRNNDVQIRQDDIYLDIANRQDTRRAKMSFKYKFGNNKVKSARRRSTATEDETSRIN